MKMSSLANSSLANSSLSQLPSLPYLLGGWSPVTVIWRLHDRHIDRPAAPRPTSGSGNIPAVVSSFTTLSNSGLILMLPAAAWACAQPRRIWGGQGRAKTMARRWLGGRQKKLLSMLSHVYVHCLRRFDMTGLIF